MTSEQLNKIVAALPEGVILVLVRDDANGGTHCGWNTNWVMRCSVEPELVEITHYNLAVAGVELEALAEKMMNKGKPN